MSEYDDDGGRLHDEPDDAPGAYEAEVYCACGARYRALVVAHDASYDSPGWLEPEPGEELCPDCR